MKVPCDQEKLSLLGRNMSFLSVMRDNSWIEIPEFENVPFHRVLHWEVKGTFLSEFIVNNKKHKGYFIMVYGMEKYGQGFMRVNGKRFSFSYFGKDKMVLVRFQSDPVQARSRQKREIKVGENIYGQR